MAPLKPRDMNKKGVSLPSSTLGHSITTRSHAVSMKKDVFPKRKADGSPLKRLTVKRSAFGDLTNANAKENIDDSKTRSTLKKSVAGVSTTKPLATHNFVKPSEVKAAVKETKKQSSLPALKKKTATELLENINPPNLIPRVSAPVVKSRITEKESEPIRTSGPITRRVAERRSNELEKTSDSLYVSALEALDLDDNQKRRESLLKRERKPPPGIEDFDKENLEDLPSVAVYAMDIFDYLKRREKCFVIEDYMDKQKYLNSMIRALLVDWMVEIQEQFELNHETLYLAVKLVDLYLSKVLVNKQIIQLIGCASLFIACKYDERSPPLIEDFLYLCDGQYKAEELIRMEIKLLKSVEFNLGVPLSYRFLRRYARCIKTGTPLLTLARYILELSLLEYSMIRNSDSKLAAASLLLALKMKGNGTWTEALEYYTGYKLDDIKDIVVGLNAMLHKKPKEGLKTIREKYSHEIFFKVALTPLLDNISW